MLFRYSLLLQAKAVTDIDVDKPVPNKDYAWIFSCAPTSPAWKDPIDFTCNVSCPPLLSSTLKTLVFDHRNAVNPCLHPHLLREHGQFLPWGKGPVLPFPSHAPFFLLNLTASRHHHHAHGQLAGQAL
ncbi:hypothetical protein EV421DRAFT_596514 [Armillaria borealis]|uniref:Uncharacterized protein n=1 Tax=Armillaria borealis TaxID=47425 RepID=A0AA39MPR4_9AGAR|nr:hypothetical protein EV421DRAFT_596514 [Armillaria borealis]